MNAVEQGAPTRRSPRLFGPMNGTGPRYSPPSPITIYDGRDDARVRGLGCFEHVAACYRWASARRRLVLGQHVDLNERAAVSAALVHALEECAAHGASLLIYASECVGAEPERLDAITRRLDGRPLLLGVGAAEQPAGRAA